VERGERGSFKERKNERRQRARERESKRARERDEVEERMGKIEEEGGGR
jgi:hypothetical protein